MSSEKTDERADVRTVEAFDYELGQLHGLPGVTFTKQATVQATNGLTESSTWIVQTYRKRSVPDIVEDAERPMPARDTIFVQFIGKGGRSLRLVIPPAVSDLIARQRDALTTKNRISGAKRAAATRKERGIVPAFSRPGVRARRKYHAKDGGK